jgi:hypothetical protein
MEPKEYLGEYLRAVGRNAESHEQYKYLDPGIEETKPVKCFQYGLLVQYLPQHDEQSQAASETNNEVDAIVATRLHRLIGCAEGNTSRTFCTTTPNQSEILSSLSSRLLASAKIKSMGIQ